MHNQKTTATKFSLEWMCSRTMEAMCGTAHVTNLQHFCVYSCFWLCVFWLKFCFSTCCIFDVNTVILLPCSLFDVDADVLFLYSRSCICFGYLRLLLNVKCLWMWCTFINMYNFSVVASVWPLSATVSLWHGPDPDPWLEHHLRHCHTISDISILPLLSPCPLPTAESPGSEELECVESSVLMLRLYIEENVNALPHQSASCKKKIMFHKEKFCPKDLFRQLLQNK